MTAFAESFGSVLTIFILIIIGYLLQNKKKITKEIGSFLSYAVVNITLPCSIFNTITTTINLDNISELPIYVSAVLASQIITMLVAWFLTKLFSIDASKKGTFITLSAFNNTLFMGMPVSVALFGEKSAPIILYYYVASTILFWTIGIRIIVGNKSRNKFKIPSPMYGVVFGFIALVVMYYVPNFKLPDFAVDTMTHLAKMTTPLSMIFTGYALGEFGLKNIRFDRTINLGLISRFIISPAIFIAVILIVGANELHRDVFIVQAFMPVMASQTIIARQYGADDKYPAVMVAISTLISLLVIPIVKVVLS